MHATIGDETEKMNLAAAGAGVLHGGDQNRVGEEVAVLDHQLDASAVHVDDTARADIKMTDLTVAHLAIGQADIVSTRVNQCIGVILEQAVVDRFASEGYGVGVGIGTKTPAVENDENKRFGTQRKLLIQELAADLHGSTRVNQSKLQNTNRGHIGAQPIYRTVMAVSN